LMIVAGHLIVAPEERDRYLADCVSVLEQARVAPGCLDFVISADLLDPGRINVYERWGSREAVEEFRGGGPSEEQGGQILAAEVTEYDVSNERALF
jgi:quinol monooxygenase YgiN